MIDFYYTSYEIIDFKLQLKMNKTYVLNVNNRYDMHSVDMSSHKTTATYDSNTVCTSNRRTAIRR